MNYEENRIVSHEDEIVSVKEWIISLLIMSVPILGLIMMFVWALGGGAKESKSNFFKAQLIMAVIATVISIIAFLLLGGLFAASYL